MSHEARAYLELLLRRRTGELKAHIKRLERCLQAAPDSPYADDWEQLRTMYVEELKAAELSKRHVAQGV